MKIYDLLNEDAKQILSEESLTAIQEAFESRLATLLKEEDLQYTEKLKSLVEALDKDHTTKMGRIVKAIDNNNSAKLIKVVKNYERVLNKEAKSFKKQMVNTVSAFLDEYLVECISTEDLTTAVKNKAAFSVLENLRGILSIDSVMMKESIRGAVLDGHNKITKLEEEISRLSKDNKVLKESHEAAKKELFLESKLSKFSDAKKAFIKKALNGKNLEFIEENFDYTTRLFDKTEKDKLKLIKEEALEKRKIKPDFVKQEKVVEESVNNDTDPSDVYLTELNKVRKFS